MKQSDHQECPGCGSELEDRISAAKRNGESSDAKSTELRDCPHCERLKCIICDMGNDVACIQCENEDDY